MAGMSLSITLVVGLGIDFHVWTTASLWWLRTIW